MAETGSSSDRSDSSIDMADAPTPTPSAPIGLVAKALAGESGLGLGLVAGGQGYTYMEELRALSADGVPPVLAAIAAALMTEVESAEGVAAACW